MNSKLVAAAASIAAFTGAVTPGQVLPSWPATWNMSRSTAIMICNNSGLVDPSWAAPWGLVDVDWNSNKNNWSTTQPYMTNEENMLYNLQQIKQVNPNGITWLYRNGIKALPWFTTVRKLLEDQSQWGLFMPLANCSPAPGVYVCGPNATNNLYHDFEQTPHGTLDECGVGVQCGEYVFNHRNASLTDFLLGDYFFGETSSLSPYVDGYYVDDGWSSSGPSEMDADAVQKMGMTPADVQAMIAAWEANQAAWRTKLVANGKFEWFLFYGGQQTAPGWNQTDPAVTCQSYMTTNCGANAPSQTGALFFGFSRVKHSQAWPLPSPTQDLAAFLITRGPYAWFGYGWTGCADADHPFTRPAELDVDYGEPTSFCAEVQPGVFQRNFTNAQIQLNCNNFVANISMIPSTA